jgi:hypothetical protein
VPSRSRIDRYKPEKLLGSAGLVDTYRVRVEGEEGPAALKVFFLDRAEVSLGRTVARRFLTAGRRVLASPASGIARILKVSDNLDAAFVATEFVPGSDCAGLAKLAGQRGEGRNAGLDPVLAGLVCAEVARILAAAHGRSAPLVHLGLCPGDVIVTPAAEVMVLDFGLAASLRGVGTCPIEKWYFVAPELIGLNATLVSLEAARKADLYSLGALLYFLLSGRNLRQATTLAELSEQARAVLPVLAGVPSEILSAVRALTAADPKDRPDSALQVVRWLEGGIDSAPERKAEIAKVLRAPGIPSTAPSIALPGTTQRAGPAKSLVQAVAPGRPVVAAPSRALASVPVARPVATGRHSRTLLAAGALLTLGIAGWIWVGYRSLYDRVRWGNGTQSPRSTNSANLHTSQSSIPTSQPHDGGSSGLERNPVASAHAIENAEMPSGEEGYVAEADSTPSRIPNHLFLDTHPSQADVWVDGVLRGKTPIDLFVGPGGHRVVAIKPGYRMFRAVFDTTLGEYARMGLQQAGIPTFGNAFLDVQCATFGKYPVLLDDEETGLLCPVDRLPVVSGKHSVGLFVPAKRANMTVELSVPPGRQPVRVMMKE